MTRRLAWGAAALLPLSMLILSGAWSLWAVRDGVSTAEAAWRGGGLIPTLSAHWAQPWRLLCAGWLHVDGAHALSNLPGFLLPAVLLARLRGGGAMLGIWGLGVIVGSLASAAFTQTWALGASGGNAALASALLWLTWRRWPAWNEGLRRWGLIGSLPWLALLLWPRTGLVDHAAHLAGVLIGPLALGLGRAGWGVGVAHLLALGVMAWTAHRPPLDTLNVPATLPDCPTGATDGLLVVCTDATIPAGMLPNGVHHAWRVGAYTLLAPPGPRARRARAALRFFDGSPILR